MRSCGGRRNPRERASCSCAARTPVDWPAGAAREAVPRVTAARAAGALAISRLPVMSCHGAVWAYEAKRCAECGGKGWLAGVHPAQLGVDRGSAGRLRGSAGRRAFTWGGGAWMRRPVDEGGGGRRRPKGWGPA